MEITVEITRNFGDLKKAEYVGVSSGQFFTGLVSYSQQYRYCAGAQHGPLWSPDA